MTTVWDNLEVLRPSLIFLAASITLAILSAYIIYKILDRLIRIPCISMVDDKYVLITGCGTGFGRALVDRLLSRGCHIIATSLHEVSMAEHDRLTMIQMDVSKHTSIERTYSKVKHLIPNGKGLWAVVNNAGVSGPIGPMAWMCRQDFQNVLDVNTLGQMDVAITFLPLVKQARGRIINMSSALGRVGIPNSGAYCMSKCAVEGMSDTLRREVQVFGVGVHIIEPGSHRTNLVDTERVTKSALDNWNRQPDEVKEEYGENFFIKLLGVGTTGLRLTSRTSLKPVIDAYEHAVLGRFPRTRYLVGLDGRIYILASFFPDWVLDLAFRIIQPTPAIMKQQ